MGYRVNCGTKTNLFFIRGIRSSLHYLGKGYYLLPLSFSKLLLCFAMENFYFYLALILPTFFIIKLLNRHHNKNLPPSPFSLPIIGHLHLLKQPLHQTLETISLQYGPILSLKFGSRFILVVSSPSAVEECFTKNDIIFANRPQTMAGNHLICWALWSLVLFDQVWWPNPTRIILCGF